SSHSSSKSQSPTFKSWWPFTSSKNEELERTNSNKQPKKRSANSSRSSSVTPSPYPSREGTPAPQEQVALDKRKAQNNIKWYHIKWCRNLSKQEIMEIVVTVVLIFLLYKYFGQNSNNVINNGAKNITSTPTPTPAPTVFRNVKEVPRLFGKIFGTATPTPAPTASVNPCAGLWGDALDACNAENGL
ncbi:MAG: hypothetical protein K2L13_00200, partial [Opitutales bacterium]|nr:hypothetical protein [Opitutales bacterium]